MNACVVPVCVCVCVCVCVIHTSRSRGVSQSRFFLFFFHLLSSFFFLFSLHSRTPKTRRPIRKKHDVCRRELGRVLENRWHVVLEVRQCLRGSCQGCFEGTAFVQGTRVDVWSLFSSSRRIHGITFVFFPGLRGLDLSLSFSLSKDSLSLSLSLSFYKGSSSGRGVL